MHPLTCPFLTFYRLKEVDDQIESLRKLLKFMEDERRRLTAIPADAHPVGVPEVLGYIMEWGVHLDAFEPEKLLQVSRHWQRVALSTPGVWARIVRKPTYMDNFSQFLLRCKKYLERSKSHPLYIDVDFLYFYFESPTNAVYTQFAELVQPHLHRCYHISLANPRESLAYLLSSLSPDVEHIAHYCANGTHRGSQITLPSVLPKLKHLSGTFPLPVFANIDMPSLEHLQLALSPVNPSFHDLLYILQRCPNLKSLLFDNVTFTLAVEPDLTSVIVQLLKLDRLEFHCSGSADAMLLTHHCALPNIRELCITGNMLPIPLELFRNITALHCSDWDFPWFIRALRVATQLESLTVRSHGADSPFHTELLPALSNTTIPSSVSLANLATSPPSSTWLVPKLRTLHIVALNYSDFPMDAFLTFLRKRSSSPVVQTIEKIVLEDVVHLTDFNIEQLKTEVEHVEVVKTTTPPISFPFFPAIGRGPDGVEGDMPAAMHPIILPPQAYGAPLITPPPIEGEDVGRNGGGIFGFGRRSRSPRRRSRSPFVLSVERRGSRSPIVISAGTRSRSRSPRRRSHSPIILSADRRRRRSPIIISAGTRSRSRTPPRRAGRRAWERSPATERYRSPTPPRGRSRENRHLRSRSPSFTTRSRSPPVRSLFVRRSRSPAVATLVLESGRSRSSRSHSPPVRLRTVEGSPASSPERTSAAERPVVTRISTGFAEGSFGRSTRMTRDVDVFANPELEVPTEVLRQSTIIVRSPTSASSSPTRSGRGRSVTRAGQVSVSSHRRRSVLPSMSSSSSSSTARSSEDGRSRSRSPYPYDRSGREFVTAPDLEIFSHPSVRPRQLQATVSASTDSTLPMGRGHTAFLTHATREAVMDPMLSPPTLPAYESFPVHPQGTVRSGPKGGRRGFAGHINDLRLFVPVTIGAPPQGPQRSVTLPSRRQYHTPANLAHNPMVSNTMDRETQRTSAAVGLNSRLRDSELVTKQDHPPSEYYSAQKYQNWLDLTLAPILVERRSSIWARLKNIVK
jgi:hypothetical protein